MKHISNFCKICVQDMPNEKHMWYLCEISLNVNQNLKNSQAFSKFM